VLVYDSKGMRAVKIYSNKNFQFLARNASKCRLTSIIADTVVALEQIIPVG